MGDPSLPLNSEGRVIDHHQAAGRVLEATLIGPGRVRLATPSSSASPVAEWLGDRPGRVHHVAFSGVTGAGVDGAVELADGSYDLPPDAATGTRLLLKP